MRVLVVDDDLDLLLLYRVLLEADGHQVSQAANGSEALSAVRDGAFDLILLDMMLPEVDGLGVLAGLAGDPRTQDVPVVIVSARVSVADQIRGLESGAVDYLTKPFSIDRLRSLVSSFDAMDREAVQLVRRAAMSRLGTGHPGTTDQEMG